MKKLVAGAFVALAFAGCGSESSASQQQGECIVHKLRAAGVPLSATRQSSVPPQYQQPIINAYEQCGVQLTVTP